MAVKVERFMAELRRFATVGIDSSILIYHLDGVEPYAELTEPAFAAIAGGAFRAVLSTVSVTEALVKPYATGDAGDVEAFVRFVLSLPNTTLVAPDFETARDAARLRAQYGLRTPDALLVATARRHAARAFLTNDASLRKVRGEGLGIVVLDDYL